MPSKTLMDRYKQDLEETKRRGGGSGWYGLQAGNNRCRFLPPFDEANAFYVRAGQHFGLGPEKKSSVYCPRICIGSKADCPICEFVETVKKKSKKPRELEMAKDYAVNVRMMALVLDRKGDDEDPKMFGYGPMIHRQVLQLVTEEYPDLYDLERGCDIVIKRDGEGLDTKYQVMPGRESTEVDPDVMDKVFDLDEYVKLRVFSPEELERVLDGEDPMKIVKEHDDKRGDDDEKPRGRGRSAPADKDDDRGTRRRRDEEDEKPRGRARVDDAEEETDTRRSRRDRDETDDRGSSRRDRNRDDRDDRSTRDRDDDRPRSRARDEEDDDKPRARSRDVEEERPRGRARDDEKPRGRGSRDDDKEETGSRRGGRDEYDDAAKKEMDRLKEKAGDRKR
jgi:hypothetical protein